MGMGRLSHPLVMLAGMELLAVVGVVAGLVAGWLAGRRRVPDVPVDGAGVRGASALQRRATPPGTLPAVPFLRPNDRVLHMDGKFPLTNYDDKDAFLKDVRARVRELGGRGYVDPAGGTLDYMLLFLPNESV